jgi:mannose-1-phosphate guanylyltransferase/mannose-6-phosphate isomerase
MAQGAIRPVILSGGAGTRLWPLSRELYPKQLLPLASENSMIQDTASRVTGKEFAAPLIVCNDEHRFIIAEQLRQLGVKPQSIVLEPMARNTAPAVAAAAALLVRDDPAALMLVLPSDHTIRDVAAFHRAVIVAAEAARAGHLVTFGIAPTGPETGYGYIRRGAALGGIKGAYAIERFVEKPDLATAKTYIADSAWSWNSGMFLFPARLLLDELAVHEPKMTEAVAQSVAKAKGDLDFLRLDPDAFKTCPSKSIDYAVMEKTKKAAIVSCSIGWSDVGAWGALWELGPRDASGNVTIGDVIAQDTKNTYLRTGDGMMLAAVGLEDAVVVVTRDVVLAATRDRAQDVKKIVDRLRADSRPEATEHNRTYRPWGFYETLIRGDRFQVKRIFVQPGRQLSLQSHFHRAEHWVVVNGTARVTRDNDQTILRENESIYLPLGCVHRLQNPGRIPLTLIEVQSGGYLGEDDIVRYEDTYGRT